MRAASPCAVPGCHAIATYRGRCPDHAAVLDRRRGSSGQRGYDAQWQQTRGAFLAEYPMCMCGARATEVHHRRARVAGGSDEWENLQALCKSCHSRTTRGGGRGVEIAGVKKAQ